MLQQKLMVSQVWLRCETKLDVSAKNDVGETKKAHSIYK